MLSQAHSIVLIWFLPVLLHIFIPLTLLVCWLLLKPLLTFRRHAKNTSETARKAGNTETTLTATRS